MQCLFLVLPRKCNLGRTIPRSLTRTLGPMVCPARDDYLPTSFGQQSPKDCPHSIVRAGIPSIRSDGLAHETVEYLELWIHAYKLQVLHDREGRELHRVDCTC